MGTTATACAVKMRARLSDPDAEVDGTMGSLRNHGPFFTAYRTCGNPGRSLVPRRDSIRVANAKGYHSSTGARITGAVTKGVMSSSCRSKASGRRQRRASQVLPGAHGESSTPTGIPQENTWVPRLAWRTKANSEAVITPRACSLCHRAASSGLTRFQVATSSYSRIVSGTMGATPDKTPISPGAVREGTRRHERDIQTPRCKIGCDGRVQEFVKL